MGAFRLTFADGGHLLLHDPRRFGSLEIAPDEERLGPDALGASLAELRGALANGPGRNGSAAPLKARLMDQERLAGVGNLLADEILWRAGPRPGGGPRSTTPRSAACTRHAGDAAPAGPRGGSHMGDLMEERRPDGRCPLDGAELRRATVGGRTTYWCPAHQH